MTPTTSLESQLDTIAAQLPGALAERIAAAASEVTASGVANGVAVGERAPAFALPDASGRVVTLDDLIARGPVVVVFYRGAWCPFCDLTLRAFQAALPDLRARGASLVAISPQAPDRALSAVEQAALEFPVLSDVQQRVIGEYRVRFEIPADLQALYLDDFGFDPRRQTADGSWNLPIPAIFVIGRDGIVVASHVDADYRHRMEPSAVLDALDSTP